MISDSGGISGGIGYFALKTAKCLVSVELFFTDKTILQVIFDTIVFHGDSVPIVLRQMVKTN